MEKCVNQATSITPFLLLLLYYKIWNLERKDGFLDYHSPISEQTQAVFTISSHEHPRDRSIIGFAKP